MANDKSKKAMTRPIVAYTLRVTGGPADGKSVSADNKAAARAAYDALTIVGGAIDIVKTLTRVVSRNDIAAIKRPRAVAQQPAATSKK